MFEYNWINIISSEELENWQYKLISEHWTIYIVYKEEIIDNI